MRAAKASDHRRRVYERSFPFALREFNYEEVPSLGDGGLTLTSGPSVICGGNGVGKSSMLHAIYLTLMGTDEGLPPNAMGRLEGGRFVCILDTPDGPVERSATIVEGVVVTGDEGPPCPVTFVDVGPQCDRWRALYHQTANLHELLESVEPAVSGARELEEVRYLARKDYTGRTVWEIDEYDESIPYFSVCQNGATYSCEDMGQGEFALHVLYWHLTRAPRDSILLLEEPETYVSPRSQQALVDVLFKYSLERSIDVVLSTHSLGVAGQVPRDAISLLFRGGGRTEYASPPRPHLLNEVLGVRQHCRGLLLVEDAVARYFTESMLARVDPDLGFLFEIEAVAGADRITQGLRGLPTNNVIQLVGVYDAGYDVDAEGFLWGFQHLPGEMSPEAVLRQFVAGRTDELTTLLRRDPVDVGLALASVEGTEDHEWLMGLAASLGIEVGRVVDTLVELWLSEEDNRAEAEGFCRGVRELVGA